MKVVEQVNSFQLKKIKYCLILAISMVLALVCYSKRALAVSNNSAQFMISPVYSSLQKGDQNSGYYDLVVKKEKTVPIKVKIANLNNKQKLTFLVKVGDAVTNDSGTIEYSNFNSGKLLTSKYKISELAKTPKQKVVVKPGSSKIVLLNLKIPKSDFPGTLAGGVYVERLNNAKTKAKKGIVTQNHFAMTLPILLAKHPKAKRIAKMVLDKVKVTKGPVIKAQLSNVNPVIFGQLMINAKIKPLNQNKTIVQKKVQGYQVAPNSTFNFLISQNSSKLKAGKYTLDILMKSGKRRWHYVKNFEIKANQAVPLNKRIKLNNLSIIMWIIMIGLILLIIALVIVILIQRRIIKLRK